MVAEALCAGCGKGAGIEAELLAEGEEARHWDCYDLPEEIDPFVVDAMSRRARGIEAPDLEHEAPKPPTTGPKRRRARGGKRKVTDQQVTGAAVISSTGGSF